MEKSNSYVYFALSGDDFDPKEVSARIGIEPTESSRKGDKGKYNPSMSFSSWKLSTAKGTETILMDNLVLEIIDRLYDKIEVINQVKKEFELNSVLEIVMDVDLNEEQSTPAIGHDLKVIEFLYKTQTRTDVDIYRYNSAQTISKPHQ
jgi:hypothetical protein